jgi:hypothetical protein
MHYRVYEPGTQTGVSVLRHTTEELAASAQGQAIKITLYRTLGRYVAAVDPDDLPAPQDADMIPAPR